METKFATIPEVTLAYLAGLVDGEGTITIRRQHRGKGKRSEEYGPWISVAQRDRAILDWIKETVGCGSVVQHTFKESHQRFPGATLVMHHWSCGYNNAYQLAKTLRPYLRIKHRQADLLVALQEAKMSWRERVLKGMRGRLATPEHVLQQYRKLCIAIQSLNGRKAVTVGPRNPDAERVGIRNAELKCSLCGEHFVSETYFGRSDLENRHHYCRPCRASGAAKKGIKRRADQKRREAKLEERRLAETFFN